MNNLKWDFYHQSLNFPPSLTSKSEEKKIEAQEYIAKATQGFDKSKKLLVLGCGDGYEIKLLLDLGFKNVKGIISAFTQGEIDSVIAAGLGKEIEFGDIHDMPFDSDEFDYVISKETLEHLLSPYIALYEINRVMKVGASFVHYVPEGLIKQVDWYHLNCYPRWLWLDLLHKTGFSVDCITPDIKQIKYVGYKKQLPEKISLYNLEGYLTRIWRD